ncbi:putative lysosomal cobalamin transporter [Balamuthia mandrillaris]
MIGTIALSWIIFAACVVALTILNWFVVRFLSDTRLSRFAQERKDKRLPELVTTLGLTVTIVAIFLIPVDIYSVSDAAGLSHDAHAHLSEAVKVLYYVLYATILVFVFVIIPFTYFFYEEVGEDVTCGGRVFAGCKYTIFLVLVVVVLLIVGIFVSGSPPDTKNKDYKKYVEDVLDTENKGEASINFAFACGAMLGYVIVLTYTAYGLSAFPLSWIKGKRNLKEEAADVESSLAITREKRRAVSSRYLSQERRVSSRDEATISLLNEQERVLTTKQQKLAAANGCWGRFLRLLAPFRFLLGIFFFLVTLLFMISLILTNIDKILHSECGAKCGYALTQPKKWNPLDTCLVLLSKYFPLDYALVALGILYFYFVTLSGISHIGIRVLWIKLYKVKARATKPQGLLIATIMMMFALLAFNMLAMTLAPQYVSYGYQTYKVTNTTTIQSAEIAALEEDLRDALSSVSSAASSAASSASASSQHSASSSSSGGGTITHTETKTCDLSSPPEECHMTQLATVFNRITMKISFFGLVFYYAIWLFVAFFLLGLVIALLRKRASNATVDSSDEEDESDDDDLRR